MSTASTASTAAPGGAPARLHGRLPLLVLLLLTCAAYAGVVHAGFVWDDQALVVRNSLTGDLGNIPRFFLIDLWDGAPVEEGVSGYYRPLVLVSFAIDRALFDLWAPGHHLHSLAWHLLAVGLLHALLRRLLSAPQALAGAAIMALHPAQSESVVWVSARNDPMAAALALAALLAVLPRDASARRLAGGALLSWAALMSKESVVLLPALLALLDLVAGRLGAPRRYLALVVGIGAGLALRLWAGVAGAAMPPAVGWALLWQNLVEVVGVYGAALAIPWPLCGVRSLEWLDGEPLWRTVGGVAAVLVLLAGPLVARGGRRRLVVAGLAWLALAVLPTLVPVADKGVIGDRYVYLGIVGLALWVVGVAGRFALPAVAVAALPWLWILHQRLPDWVDDRSLWEAAERDIDTPYTSSGLGHILLIEGQPGEALVRFEEALAASPPALDGCVAIMQAAVDLNRYRLAAARGEWALSRGCPRTGEHLGFLAALQGQTGQWEAARATLHGAPPDPRGRDTVAAAALARLDGDTEAFERLAATWTGSAPLAEQADGLIQASAAFDPAAPPIPPPEPARPMTPPAP